MFLPAKGFAHTRTHGEFYRSPTLSSLPLQHLTWQQERFWGKTGMRRYRTHFGLPGNWRLSESKPGGAKRRSELNSWWHASQSANPTLDSQRQNQAHREPATRCPARPMPTCRASTPAATSAAMTRSTRAWSLPSPPRQGRGAYPAS